MKWVVWVHYISSVGLNGGCIPKIIFSQFAWKCIKSFCRGMVVNPNLELMLSWELTITHVILSSLCQIQSFIPIFFNGQSSCVLIMISINMKHSDGPEADLEDDKGQW
jgi:hypothetical protein